MVARWSIKEPLMCKSIILEFEMYMCTTCPKTMVETLMIKRFGVYYKGHKSCADKFFISSSLFPLSSFSPYTSIYSTTTTTYVKNMWCLVQL
jgi:hypothetical protein